MSTDFQTANALHQEGKLDEAIDAYRQIDPEDADYFKAMNNLGLILENRGELSAAEKAYQAAVDQKGDSAILHYNLARVLHRTDRLLPAVEHYQKAIEYDKEWAEPVYNLAIAYHQQDRHATAEHFYRQTIELAPTMPPAHRYLGDLLFDVGRHEEALESYQRSLELDAEQPSAHFNLGKTLYVFGRFEEAEAAYRRSLEIDPHSNAVYSNLVDLLRRTERHEEAKQVVQQWKTNFPENAVAQHTWAALTGEDAPDRAPDSYVSEMFDEFAADFDSTLSKLDYKAPRLVAEALAAVLEQESDQATRQVTSQPSGETPSELRVLDAGCGTGLCGPLLRQRATRLCGVDLSRGMLEKAHNRRMYDELEQEELTIFLKRRVDDFDAIIAADTINYFGALEEVFAATSASLHDGGWFVFTLERHDEPDWRLNQHGRYSHSESYLRKALETAGFQLHSLVLNELRNEGGKPVAGWTIVARK